MAIPRNGCSPATVPLALVAVAVAQVRHQMVALAVQAAATGVAAEVVVLVTAQQAVLVALAEQARPAL